MTGVAMVGDGGLLGAVVRSYVEVVSVQSTTYSGTADRGKGEVLVLRDTDMVDATDANFNFYPKSPNPNPPQRQTFYKGLKKFRKYQKP